MKEENLGISIKNLRKNKKMTLKELSEKTDLSISFLSQLERGKSSATLNSLKKISLALDVSPSLFFNNTVDDNDQKKLVFERMAETPFFYKDLSGDMKQLAFSPLLVVMKPGQNEGSLFSHKGQEFLYVLEGQLTVQIEESIEVLNPNESKMFDSNRLHYWYNYTDEDVRFLCISYDEK